MHGCVLPKAGCKSWRCWSVWRGECCKKQSYLSWSIKLRRWGLTSGYSACVQRQFWESLVSGQLLCRCTKLVWSGNSGGIPDALALPGSTCRVCEPVNWSSCCCTTIPSEGSRQCSELHSSAVPCSCSVPLIDLKSFPHNLKSTNYCITHFKYKNFWRNASLASGSYAICNQFIWRGSGVENQWMFLLFLLLDSV